MLTLPFKIPFAKLTKNDLNQLLVEVRNGQQFKETLPLRVKIASRGDLDMSEFLASLVEDNFQVVNIQDKGVSSPGVKNNQVVITFEKDFPPDEEVIWEEMEVLRERAEVANMEITYLEVPSVDQQTAPQQLGNMVRLLVATMIIGIAAFMFLVMSR